MGPRPVPVSTSVFLTQMGILRVTVVVDEREPANTTPTHSHRATTVCLVAVALVLGAAAREEVEAEAQHCS